MSLDIEPDWLPISESTTMVSHCVWIKITQLLGEVSCYLLPAHDGAHCSIDWMEWT
jgi:hypothetical protein